MQEPISITRAEPSHPSMDFTFLREEGLRLIQNLSSNLWTDYNIHDPGITTLEQLAYAITELGYRASFDVKDIVTPNPTSGRKLTDDFFTASQILPNAPVTIDDLRRLLVDIRGIKNALFDTTAASELQVYIDRDNNRLTFEETAEELIIRGLYSVTLELDIDPVFGDLNSNAISQRINVENNSLRVQYIFPNWLEVDERFRERDLSADINGIEVGEAIRVDAGNFIYPVTLAITGESDVEINVEADVITSLVGTGISETILVNSLQALIEGNGMTSDLISFYSQKIRTIGLIVEEVNAMLQANRNLCEDYVGIRNLEVEEVAICSQIEVAQGVDVSTVLGEIYFKLESFLSPRVRFRTLQEMFQLGNRVEDIFNGPLLRSGFLDDGEFGRLEEREVVHLSDLINLIMDVEGVVGIKQFELSSFVDGNIIADRITSSLRAAFQGTHRLRFSAERSSVIFFSDEDPLNPSVNYILANRERVLERMEMLRTLDPSFATVDEEREFPVPVGSFRDLEEYFSLQEDYPLTYGISSAGPKPIPNNEAANQTRLAQAKQLKGYLLFAEQLLANFYAQLSRVGDIFSVSSTLERTYFTNPIYDVPNVGSLIRDFVETSVPPSVSLDNTSRINELFQEYQSSTNAFATQLDAIAESETEFRDRSQRLLEHLLARFSEDFTNYTLKTFELFGQTPEVEEAIIQDQRNFLANLPQLGSERFLGYNQRDEGNVWNTSNISGLARRVAGRLGIENSNARSLFFRFEEREADVMVIFHRNRIVVG